MKTLIETAKILVPSVDTLFQLNINNYPEPISMVTLCGFNYEWRFLGPLFGGNNAYYHVMLKNFGSVNFMQATEKANKMGYRLLEGQAAKAIMQYEAEKNVSIMLGGSQWQVINGSTRIICVYTECQDNHWVWKIGIPWSVDKCNKEDLWLVVDEKITRSSQLYSSRYPLK